MRRLYSSYTIFPNNYAECLVLNYLKYIKLAILIILFVGINIY